MLISERIIVTQTWILHPKSLGALFLFVAFLLCPRSPGMVVLQLLWAGEDPSPTARNKEKAIPCETIIGYPQIHNIPSLLVHLEEWHLDQCKRHFALVDFWRHSLKRNKDVHRTTAFSKIPTNYGSMIPSNKGVKSKNISASAPHDLEMSPCLQLKVRIAVAAKPAKNPLMPSAQTSSCGTQKATITRKKWYWKWKYENSE